MKLWTMLSPVVWIVGVLMLWGCSGVQQTAVKIAGDGGKTVGFDDSGRLVEVRTQLPLYRVLTRQTTEAWTVSQISAQTVELCQSQFSSEEMAILRDQANGEFVSRYYNCKPAVPLEMTTEPGKASYFKDVPTAAALGAIGYGLTNSGDTVTNSQGQAQAQSQSLNNSKTVIKKRRR